MYHVEFDLEFKKNHYPGKFIVIEGIDGSGKTTQASKIVEHLRRIGAKSVYTKEPTDEVTGKLIRRILSGDIEVPAVAFQYLFAADRAVHQIRIEKYLKEGFTVVSDRYFWSSAVYGMVDRGITNRENDKDRLLVALSILSMYHRFLVPDYTFYLKVSTKEAVARIDKKAEELEIYERQEKLEKIRQGYEWLVKKFSNEITVVEGEKSVEEVKGEIVKSVKRHK